MLERAASYEDLQRQFRWRIPDRYNIGVDACDRHADGTNRLALTYLAESGAVLRYGFDDLKALSNRLANAFLGRGLVRGDRVGILLAQSPETAVAHLAAYKAGLIAVPLFVLFGPDAIEYRLADSGAAAVVTDAAGYEKLAGFRDRLPELRHVFLSDGGEADALNLQDEIDRARVAFRPVDTAADDPALIIYTSGTTGNPKGALHAHRALLGHLPGVELPQEFFPQPGDHFWTPADWAWIGGLLDVLLPSWHHGVPVLAHRMRKFDPEHAFRLMAEHGVRNAFIPPTALKLMRQVSSPAGRQGLRLRSIGSGGETLGAELLTWAKETFGVTVNEFYGQTECNLIVSNCSSLFPVRPGAMGRPVPGHTVAVIDSEGNEVPAGQTGQVAVRRPDPVMFLGYWNRAQATEEKFRDDWLLTGDMARRDEDGYLWFVGRADDVITSAGYRIGPGEIEDCLMKHPAVAMAAVVGVPDPVRTEVVKAVIVLRDGLAGSDPLAREIQDFVKTRLAAHEYPRIVEFASELPTTATGKIIRRALRGNMAGS
jgi:acetyl-CoA synthetase